MNQKTRWLHFHKANGTFLGQEELRELVLTSKLKQTWHKSQAQPHHWALIFQDNFPPNPAGWQLKWCIIQQQFYLTNYQPGVIMKGAEKWNEHITNHLLEPSVWLRKWELKTMFLNKCFTVSIKKKKKPLMHFLKRCQHYSPDVGINITPQ